MVAAQIINLRSPDYTVRRCAATALGLLGLDAEAAIPALMDVAREDHEPTVREAAEKALNRITSLLTARRSRNLVRS
jgi:HEAT repeat protein